MENGPGTRYISQHRIQDFTGRAVTYTYSADGYLTRATYPDGSFEVSYGYDARASLATVAHYIRAGVA